MERVFINIIDNALYALNEKFQKNRATFIPELQVELLPGKTLCRLSVRDNGTGIPQNHLPNVCDEFYTTKPPGEGTGLGLWIAKQNVEKNRGSFRILSKENEFTQITIELPSAPRTVEVSL
ncbi:HAMP domain-containing sensor histidine kinase [Bdellovibrio bacteriovorus]|nr:HAMP domain-containing sensor histidine kinase [Bdellovibrio bacteriovorus]